MRKSPSQAHSTSPKRKPWIMLGAIGLCAVALTITGFMYIPKLTGPTKGQILHPAQTYKSAAATTRTITTPYYTAAYPAAFHLLPQPEHSASLDAQKLAASPETGYGISSQITLTVVRLGSGGITQDSSYLLFHSRPETYTLTTRTIGSDTVVVSSRTTPDYEKAILWPHDGLLLTIDLTAAGQTPDTDAGLDTLISGVHWLR